MKYRPEIDGLRALAVVPVIFFHAGVHLFSGGYIGVDVFFVISGYLISTIILAEKDAGAFSIIRFYERRARRILPALFFVMMACLPFAWVWLLPEDMKSFSQSLIAVPAFVSNMLFWKTSGYFDIAAELKPLLHTWSLAVEEQYYLLFPPLLMMTWRYGRQFILTVLLLILVSSLGLAQWASASKPDAAYYLLLTRGWEILIGSLVALHLSRPDAPLANPKVSQAGRQLGRAGADRVCHLRLRQPDPLPQRLHPGPYAGRGADHPVRRPDHPRRPAAGQPVVRGPGAGQLQRLPLAPAPAGLRAPPLLRRREHGYHAGCPAADRCPVVLVMEVRGGAFPQPGPLQPPTGLRSGCPEHGLLHRHRRRRRSDAGLREALHLRQRLRGGCGPGRLLCLPGQPLRSVQSEVDRRRPREQSDLPLPAVEKR